MKKDESFLVKNRKLDKFYFRQLREKTLITNDGGNWISLPNDDFRRFISGKIKNTEKLYQELEKKGFINVGKKKLSELASQYLKLNYSLSQGPSLFIIVLTLRCNHRCLYCQVIPENPKQKGFDMGKATAKKTVDLIFRTPSESVRLEFQGGEPLLNWPVLKYVVKYAKEVNKKKKKNLKISIVSNLSLMDDEKLKFLLDEEVDIACSLDGPAKVHDKNRTYLDGASSHKVVSVKIKKIQKEIKKKQEKTKEKTDKLNAILTVTKFSLPYYKEIIDEYMSYGLDNVFIRPLSPFGLERKTTDLIGYTAEEFLEFYKKSLDYIVELNLKGKLFAERGTFNILRKILKQEDPNFLELRSPCGAGIGQMAFDYDGKIFTCDEGRMARRMSHDNFMIGEVDDNDYNRLIDNEVVKTMCLASSLDNHAGCQDCVYKPYCGVCPLANYIECGTIFPQLANTLRCRINKGIFDYIFRKMGDKKYRTVFESWVGKGL